MATEPSEAAAAPPRPPRVPYTYADYLYAKEYRDTETKIQGVGIVLAGGAFAYYGFKRGVAKQLNEVAHDEGVKIPEHQVGPSGYTPRQMVIRAFVRGSLIAMVGASVAGIGFAWASSNLREQATNSRQAVFDRELEQELKKAFQESSASTKP